MDNTNNGIKAVFDAKKTWVTLWIFAVAGLVFSLRALSLVKPKTCVALCIAALVLSAAGTLAGVYASKARLCVEEKFICCKTVLGKQIHIPLDTVTGIKITFFGTVCIFAPSCRIRFPFVKNKSEILNAVKERIKDRT